MSSQQVLHALGDALALGLDRLLLRFGIEREEVARATPRRSTAGRRSGCAPASWRRPRRSRPCRSSVRAFSRYIWRGSAGGRIASPSRGRRSAGRRAPARRARRGTEQLVPERRRLGEVVALQLQQRLRRSDRHAQRLPSDFAARRPMRDWSRHRVRADGRVAHRGVRAALYSSVVAASVGAERSAPMRPVMQCPAAAASCLTSASQMSICGDRLDLCGAADGGGRSDQPTAACSARSSPSCSTASCRWRSCCTCSARRPGGPARAPKPRAPQRRRSRRRRPCGR